MSRLHIPNFLGGMNSVNSNLQIELNQFSLLENLIVSPPSAGIWDADGNSAFRQNIPRNALSTRNWYIALGDGLPLSPNIDKFGDLLAWTPPTGSAAGQRDFIGIGYDSVAGLYRCFRFVGDATSGLTVELFNAAAAAPLMNFGWIQDFGNYLYVSDGVSIATRRIDGSYVVTTLGAAVHPKCLIAGTHKNRFILANEYVNQAYNRLWLSNVGDAETFPATQYIEIGDKSEHITGVLDQFDRLIVFKEHSVWAVYLSTNLVDSQIIPIDKFRGIPGPKNFVSTPYGIFMYSTVHGLMVLNNTVEIIDTPISNLITGTTIDIQDGTWETYRGSIGYDKGQIFISNIQDYLESGGISFPHVTYVYDIKKKTAYRLLYPQTIFYSKTPYSGTALGGIVGVIKDASINAFTMVQFDPQDDHNPDNESPSGSIAVAFWGYHDFGFPEKYKSINYVTLTFLANRVDQTLQIETYCDGALEQSDSFVPSSGLNILKAKFNPDTSKGRNIGIRLSYPIAKTSVKASFINMTIDYNLENAVI